jgi:hypothetical protein
MGTPCRRKRWLAAAGRRLAAAKGWEHQLRELGRWVRRADLARALLDGTISPEAILVWDRAGGTRLTLSGLRARAADVPHQVQPYAGKGIRRIEGLIT